ncbi:DUF6247 family protein [Streptomyces silvensis]|uniref:Uncharacterized protein n=1 Tax=Streptomyces silvensis TaxID=1765722 RepID=A0A0W7X4M7_9ACTN|nr:DUF6247 family protein [Streptomyces silvensis]KUF17655.1 hypothetical protein AT728_09630 [Streptomyces silvensis]
MTVQRGEPSVPVVPQPPMTRDALRSAVRQLDLARLGEFDTELGEAFDRAVQMSSTTPMRLFLEKWATVVAILRYPDRARRLHAAEQELADVTISEDAFRQARTAIREVLDAASREVLPDTHR